jgi:hypothetical protein
VTSATAKGHPVWVPDLRIYLCSECHTEAQVGIVGGGQSIYCYQCQVEPIGEDDGRFYEDEPTPEWLEHLSVLRLEPGDVVVIRCQERLSPDAVRHIEVLITGIFGTEHRVMVLERGMDIGVIHHA